MSITVFTYIDIIILQIKHFLSVWLNFPALPDFFDWMCFYITDRCIEEIDKITQAKEKDILEI